MENEEENLSGRRKNQLVRISYEEIRGRISYEEIRGRISFGKIKGSRGGDKYIYMRIYIYLYLYQKTGELYGTYTYIES